MADFIWISWSDGGSCCRSTSAPGPNSRATRVPTPMRPASYPHPQGMIEVKYDRRGIGIEACIILPGTLGGEFEFNGKRQVLKPGVNHITIQ